MGETGEGAESDEDVETGEGAEAAGLWAARLRGRLRSQGFKEACRSKLRKARRLGFREACRFGGFVKPADQACARRNPSATTRRSFVAPPFERGSLLLPHFGD